MAMSIVLQDETGVDIDRVEDPKNGLAALLLRNTDKAFCLLSGIDRYGDTIFNHVQMERFLNEWDTLIQYSNSEEERLLLVSVKRLAVGCRNGIHLYLKFMGD